MNYLSLFDFSFSVPNQKQAAISKSDCHFPIYRFAVFRRDNSIDPETIAGLVSVNGILYFSENSFQSNSKIIFLLLGAHLWEFCSCLQ